MTLAGAVLAGGASRRMGRPKAFIEIDGQAMVLRVADALAAAGAEPVVVVGGAADRLSGLGLAAVADEFPDEGPLGGVITALRTCRGADAIAVLSCDLLEPSAAQIAALADALDDADVVVPSAAGRRQWTHAVWSVRCLTTLEAAFAAGERAPRNAVASLSVRDVAIPDADLAAYADADTPDDLPGHTAP